MRETETTKAPRTTSRYRKVEVRTWGDEKFRGLSAMPACGQGLWLYLITGPHTGPIPGLFRAGRAGMARKPAQRRNAWPCGRAARASG